MNKSIAEIPYNITDYIHEHFRGAEVDEIKKISDATGRIYYLAEVLYNGSSHWMKFDEQGFLEDKEPTLDYQYEKEEDLFEKTDEFESEL